MQRVRSSGDREAQEGAQRTMSTKIRKGACLAGDEKVKTSKRKEDAYLERAVEENERKRRAKTEAGGKERMDEDGGDEVRAGQTGEVVHGVVLRQVRRRDLLVEGLAMGP